MFLPSPVASFTPASRRAAAFCVLVAGLYLADPRQLKAESALQFKYEDYRESDGRIRVVAKYGLAQISLNDATQLSVRGVLDTITGATPTGEPAPVGSDQVPLATLEDERHAAIASLTRMQGEWRFNGEFAWSKEDDYLSLGYSLSAVRLLNQKNTELQVGFSYVDDAVQPVFFTESRPKDSWDFLVGVTQILGPNTRLTANLAYGTSKGYLSDPYKIVLKTTELAPGLSLGLTFPENRPTEKEKTIAFLELAHFVEPLHGGVESSVRLYRDDHGVNSTTLDLAWRQRLGTHWIAGPLVRWYQQSAADYYYPDLDATTIVPAADPDATTAHYSSDYRLSEFDATTVGAKVIYEVNDRWAFDLTYERYTMNGRDGVTSDSAYCTANIFTLGGKFSF